MKAGKVILIVILVIAILYFAYKYFYPNKVKFKSLADFSSPRDYHAYQVQSGQVGVIQSKEVASEEKVDYAELNANLVTLLQALGYYVVVDNDKNTITAIGDPKNSNASLVQKFAIKYPGTGMNFVAGKDKFGIDTAKWNEFVGKGLLNIVYKKDDNDKILNNYNQLIEFFGSDFFQVLAKPKEAVVVKEEIVVSKDALCKGLGYQQQLSLAGIDVEQAKRDLFFARLNHNNFDNQENREKLTNAQKKLDSTGAVYEEIYKKCN